MYFPYKIIDLSHPLSEEIPCWNNSCGFNLTTTIDYSDCSGPTVFRVQRMNMHAGIGTHIDAPAHTVPGGETVLQLLLQNLIVPCVVINVAQQSHQDYKISLADVEFFEQKHGPILKNSCVFFYTGWSERWNNRDQYHNNHKFPSVDSAVASYLIAKDIAGLGIDTLSCDVPSGGFPVHTLMLGAGKYLIENVANLYKLPAVGSFSCALPLPIRQATESSVRLVAFLSTT